MRRLYPSLVLVLLLAAPLLQLQCAIACATAAASKSAHACHSESATTPDDSLTLASPHDCGAHSAPTAIVRATRAQNVHVLVAASMAQASVLVITPFATSSLVAAPPGGPPGGLVVPLRV